jgi:hypothetical protein
MLGVSVEPHLFHRKKLRPMFGVTEDFIFFTAEASLVSHRFGCIRIVAAFLNHGANRLFQAFDDTGSENDLLRRIFWSASRQKEKCSEAKAVVDSFCQNHRTSSGREPSGLTPCGSPAL